MPNADGRAVIGRAVDLFYERMLADPVLAPWFAGVDLDRLRAHQRAFLRAALAGPDVLDLDEVASAHHGLGIDDDAYDRAVGHLVAALEEAGVDAVAAARLCAQLEPLRHRVVRS